MPSHLRSEYGLCRCRMHGLPHDSLGSVGAICPLWCIAFTLSPRKSVHASFLKKPSIPFAQQNCRAFLLFGSLAMPPGPVRMGCGNWDDNGTMPLQYIFNAAHIIEQECLPSICAALMLGDVLRQTHLAPRHVIARSALSALATVSLSLLLPATFMIDNCCVVALPVGAALRELW